jgi:hypothetical protein
MNSLPGLAKPCAVIASDGATANNGDFHGISQWLKVSSPQRLQ